MIAVVDYGMGNLRSVQKAFEVVGSDAIVTSDPQRIAEARSVVLPGVGAFKDCMDNLNAMGLTEPVCQAIHIGKPFLGICLGLQLLFEHSVEFGTVPGLGILPGKVQRFDPDAYPDLKVPHMGWNTLNVKKSTALLEPTSAHPFFYFVHSYYVQPEDPGVIATTTEYGVEFVSGIQHENIHAFQFHPEKSQKAGLTLLKKFSSLN